MEVTRGTTPGRRTLAYRLALLGLASLAAVVAAAGCALGPRQIQVGHLRYNQAIKESFDRELLLNLVRMKYRETPEFVDIAGVAAQYNFEASGEASGTFFDFIKNFQGAGLRGTIDRAERPTISYAPLRAKEFETRLMTPVAVTTIGMMANKGWRIDRILRVSARSINLLENATAAGGPTPATTPEYAPFLRATALLRQLQNDHAIEFAQMDREQRTEVPLPESKVDGAFVLGALEKGYRFEGRGGPVVLVRSKKDYVMAIHPAVLGSPPMNELATLLQLEPGHLYYPFGPAEQSRFLAAFDRGVRRTGADQPGSPTPPLPPEAQLPAIPGSASPPPPLPTLRTDVGIHSRSLYEMMYYLAQNVEAPDLHVRRGLVTVTRDATGCPFDWNRLLGDLFRVQVSWMRPCNAYLAVHYRGYWYYIADDDLESKSTLGLLQELFNIEIRGGGAAGNTPVLTLGVGK